MRRRAYRADHLGDLGRFESDHRHVIRREHERDELLMPADDVVAAFAQAALHKVLMDIARLTCLDRPVRTRRSTSDRRSGGGRCRPRCGRRLRPQRHRRRRRPPRPRRRFGPPAHLRPAAPPPAQLGVCIRRRPGGQPLRQPACISRWGTALGAAKRIRQLPPRGRLTRCIYVSTMNS